MNPDRSEAMGSRFADHVIDPLDLARMRVEQYRVENAAEWDAFVDSSMNGTVFQKQRFLAYHPNDRFTFHHLLFYYDETLIALLPGGIISEGGSHQFESPLGSSYGSFVIKDISARRALLIVKAFEDYVLGHNISEVFLTSAPVIYQPVLTQNLDFALLYGGFQYQRHYISHAIDLSKEGSPFDRFQATTRKYIRRIRRENRTIEIEIVPKGELDRGLREFFPILLENKAKYNATPTHSLEELLRLSALLPELMQLFLVRHNGEAIAGSLLFLANPRVALIFYHMLRYEFEHLRPIYLLMDAVTRWSKEQGFRFVDIGVSQDTNDANPMTPALSLIEFKEKFDSRGLLRSTLHKRYAA